MQAATMLSLVQYYACVTKIQDRLKGFQTAFHALRDFGLKFLHLCRIAKEQRI
jgi:hypothetical protein